MLKNMTSVNSNCHDETHGSNGGMMNYEENTLVVYGEQKRKKYPMFDVSICKGWDIIDPTTTGPQELRNHFKTTQELAPETIKKTMNTLGFHEHHPIVPLDLRNPSFENFRDHIKCCRELGVPDRWTGELKPITKISEHNLRKAWNRACKAWGVFEVWPKFTVRKIPQRIKPLVLYTPEQAYQLHHGIYVKDRHKNRLIQYLYFFGNIVGLAPEKEWVILNLDDLQFQKDGTCLITCRRPKINNKVRTLRLEKTPSTSPVHKNLVDLINNRDRFAERTENALLVNPSTGRRWVDDDLRRCLTKNAQKVIPGFYPYMMRHWCLTARMIEWKKNEFALSKVAYWAGHGKNLGQTQDYIELASLFDDKNGSWLRRALNLKRDLVQDSAASVRQGFINDSTFIASLKKTPGGIDTPPHRSVLILSGFLFKLDSLRSLLNILHISFFSFFNYFRNFSFTDALLTEKTGASFRERELQTFICDAPTTFSQLKNMFFRFTESSITKIIPSQKTGGSIREKKRGIVLLQPGQLICCLQPLLKIRCKLN